METSLGDIVGNMQGDACACRRGGVGCFEIDQSLVGAPSFGPTHGGNVPEFVAPLRMVHFGIDDGQVPGKGIPPGDSTTTREGFPDDGRFGLVGRVRRRRWHRRVVPSNRLGRNRSIVTYSCLAGSIRRVVSSGIVVPVIGVTLAMPGTG